MALLARVAILSVLLAGWAAAGPETRVTRDLTKFPAGKYEIVQSYDFSERSTLERPGKEVKKEKPRRNRNTFTFDLVVKPPVALVTVRRIEIRVEGEQSLAYDSKEPDEKNSDAIREQFHRLLGRTTRVDLKEYGKGKGFSGLDAAFEEYREAHPDRADWAESNRRNYGDARIDRIFARGLDVLFGADAGRASGKARTLKAGQEFEVKLERSGIGWKKFMATHQCVVKSDRDGVVALEVSWKKNGLEPQPQEDGSMVVRGADIKSRTLLEFHAASGLLVGMHTTIERTDQVAVLPNQRTWHSVEKMGLTIRRKTEDASTK